MMPSGGGAPDTLQRVATRCGALSWICDSLFVLQGRWAGTMLSPVAVAHLAEHSRHHGWHAQLLRELLPDSPALDGPSMVAAPPGWADAVATADTADGDPARLAVLYRVLVPRLAGEVDALRADLVGPGDAAMARVLGIVATDVGHDLVRGGALLARALVTPADVASAAEAVTSIDGDLAGRWP